MSSACHGCAGVDGLKPDENGSEEQKALAQISSRFSEKKVSIVHSLSPGALHDHITARSNCAALHMLDKAVNSSAGSSRCELQLILS